MSKDDTVKRLSKEDFFIKLNEYSDDNYHIRSFFELKNMYNLLNLKVEYFVEKKDDDVFFYVKPKLKNKIGYKIGGKKYG